jgi:hypothetical protein
VAVINEEESMCKKAVAASFKVQSRYSTRGTEEDKEKIVLGNQYPGRYLIRSCPEQLDSTFFVHCYTLLYSTSLGRCIKNQ